MTGGLNFRKRGFTGEDTSSFIAGFSLSLPAGAQLCQFCAAIERPDRLGLVFSSQSFGNLFHG